MHKDVFKMTNMIFSLLGNPIFFVGYKYIMVFLNGSFTIVVRLDS